MNFKKAINYSSLEKFFLGKGFSIVSESGDIVITSPNGYYIAISQPRKDSDMIYLDCNLINEIGLRDFIKEWPSGTNVYDYIVNICYPLLSNLRGWATLKQTPDIVIKMINNELMTLGIEYEFYEKTDITYIRCAPQRELYKNTIPYKLFSFYKNNRKYGIILKQFNAIYLARFQDNSNTVLYEYPWFSFCPMYKIKEDYVKTTIINFFEFIEIDNV